MSVETLPQSRLRTIRSFVLRKGRSAIALDLAGKKLWQKYGIDTISGKTLNFDDIFGNNAPIVLEIGFGNGKNLLHMAKRYPQLNFVGIEVYQSGIAQLLTEIELAAIPNIRVMRGDAVEILQKYIPAQSLHILQIFFPDPWPKARHHKRRLIQLEFVSLVVGKLITNGVLHIATDWANYAEHVLAVMATRTEFLQLPANLLGEHTLDRLTTKFEQRGKQLGHTIYDFAFRLI